MALKSREKTLLVCVLVAIAIWAFDRFYYTPQNQMISALQQEIKSADQKLNEYLLLTNGMQTAETEVTRLEAELKRLKERTLRGEEFRTFLKHLARESDPLQLKVISLLPGEERLTPSQPEQKRGPSPLQLSKVTVLMVLHSTYAKLGNYLKEIGELPFLVNVDNAQIEKKEEIAPLLRVTLRLSMYVISF